MDALDQTTDLFRLLGDSSRVRLLALLEREEMTVAELVAATGLAQSRVSTHLARLKEAGFVQDRRAGVSAFYRATAPPSSGARKAWAALRGSTFDPILEEDLERARELLASRAGAEPPPGLERHYVPGRSWESLQRALLGFLSLGDLVDIACGDGAVAELLAPRARSVTGVDLRAEALAQARRRLGRRGNVSLRRADMHALPFPDASFDQALLLNCLTLTERPERAVAEAARVLRPGGALVAATLCAHAHEEAARRFGHLLPGFEPARLASMLQGAGFRVTLCAPTHRERRVPRFEILTAHGVRR